MFYKINDVKPLPIMGFWLCLKTEKRKNIMYSRFQQMGGIQSS